IVSPVGGRGVARGRRGHERRGTASRGGLVRPAQARTRRAARAGRVRSRVVRPAGSARPRNRTGRAGAWGVRSRCGQLCADRAARRRLDRPGSSRRGRPRARARGARHAGRARGGGDRAVAGETSRVISLATVRRALRDHRPQVADAPDARPAALVPSDEVQRAFWLPLRRLSEPNVRREVTLTLHGAVRTFPAYLVDDDVIWGMTERILTPFVDLVSNYRPDL